MAGNNLKQGEKKRKWGEAFGAQDIFDNDEKLRGNIRGYIEELKKDLKCGFCGGWGHHAGKCATKKVLDRHFSCSPAFKSVWGDLKHDYLQEKIVSKVAEGIKERKILNAGKK